MRWELRSSAHHIFIAYSFMLYTLLSKVLFNRSKQWVCHIVGSTIFVSGPYDLSCISDGSASFNLETIES